MTVRNGTAATRSGQARVYLHPEPASGPHPGYRGDITADVLGVHLQPDAELISNDDHGWDVLGIEITVPWARVNSIEWGAPE
jgi:hypothetical protein